MMARYQVPTMNENGNHHVQKQTKKTQTKPSDKAVLCKNHTILILTLSSN